MKCNHLVAAALAPLALASGMARADNVTLYGILDLAVEHLTNVNSAGDSLTRMGKLSGAAPSRFGLRGGEDLGGGYSTVFALESGIQMATGALNNGNRLFGRAAYVGVNTPYGRLTIGRQYNMTVQALAVTDIVGPALYSLASMDAYLPNSITDNTIAYLGTYGGFSAGASYSTGRDTSSAGGPAGTNCPGEAGADSRQCAQWTTMAKYEGAGYGVAAAYDTQRGGPNAAFGLSNSRYTDTRSLAGGWFRAGPVKIAGGLLVRERDLALKTTSRMWYAGASWPLSERLVVDGQVARYDVLHSDDDSLLVDLRASYYFSKRTRWYVMAGSMRNDGLAVNPLSGGATVGPGKHQNGVMTGMQLTF